MSDSREQDYRERLEDLVLAATEYVRVISKRVGDDFYTAERRRPRTRLDAALEAARETLDIPFPTITSPLRYAASEAARRGSYFPEVDYVLAVVCDMKGAWVLDEAPEKRPPAELAAMLRAVADRMDAFEAAVTPPVPLTGPMRGLLTREHARGRADGLREALELLETGHGDSAIRDAAGAAREAAR